MAASLKDLGLPLSPGTPAPVAVGLGEARALRSNAAGQACLVAYGLGSCVAICLLEPRSGVLGMAHVVLPGASPTGAPNAKFARSALPMLLERMVEVGASRDPRLYVARLAGGAQVLAISSGNLPPIGTQNAAAVRETLGQAGIQVVGEDLGGAKGRTVWFDPREGGRIRVRTVGSGERLI